MQCPCATLLVLLLACGSGCRKELQTVYGQRSGPGASESVNGTAVFAEMFETAGHRVSTWGSLSPRLDQADCVVWFPDDFQPPGPGVSAWFERWLAAKPNRTLIYVGRDFDAAPWYWRKMEATAPARQQEAIADAGTQAEQAFQSARPRNQSSAMCRWFTVRYDAAAGPARNVSGDLEWLHNIDPSQLEVEMHSRILPAYDMEALLESDEGLILGRLDGGKGQGQILVVSNGSFLLNAMLVNHEHRKLAGKLVDAIGPSGQEVVFLETGRITIDQSPGSSPGIAPSPFGESSDDDNEARRKRALGASSEPIIRRADPVPELPTGLELLLQWPTNWIGLHFVLVGILFCFWKLPIVGLPRPEDPAGAADFGRHIDAVAALLQRTADRRYALSRVQHYQQVVKKTE